MYLVLNQSKRLITVSDLDVSIPAGTMLDLDKYKKNRYLNPRDSKDLQEALRRGLLRTMKNDKPDKKETHTSEPSHDSNKNLDISEMMKIMKETIREEMKKNKIETKTEQILVQSDNSTLIEMISDIKGLIAKGSLNASDIDGIAKEMLIDDSIDESKLKEIHAAAMRKMKDKSGLKSEISYDINTVKDDNITNDLEDLEDII